MTRAALKPPTIRVMAVAPLAPETAIGVDVEALYQDHYDAVMRYVRARVGSKETAEDLVADVFCRALGAATKYRALRETPLPWLYRIAAHRVADHYRRQRPACGLDAAAEVVATGPGPDDVVLQKLAVTQVWELSQGLPKSQQRALWLRYGRQLELSEIAQRMGKSVEAVKLLIHRAVKHLRYVLTAETTGRVAGVEAHAQATSRRGSGVRRPGRQLARTGA